MDRLPVLTLENELVTVTPLTPIRLFAFLVAAYACDNNCDVFNNNEICVTTPTDWNHNAEECVRANETSRRVTGGDALMYFHLGMDVKAKVPLIFDVDQSVTTGGWIGPYTLLLPDGGPDSDITRMRYAMTPLSDYFHAPEDYTITGVSTLC